MVRKGVIIQVRTDSTRLPNKAFSKLPFNFDLTAIEQVIIRSKKIMVRQ